MGSRRQLPEYSVSIGHKQIEVQCSRNYRHTQLNNQLLAVVMDSDLARTLSGKISPVTTHAQGPQEEAKKKM